LSGKTISDKRSIRKAKIRQAIKDAALDIAEKEGWNGVTIRKIADSIDYTAPIVYEHFRNKDDLYHQLVHDGFRMLSTATMEEVAQVDSAVDKLMTMAEVRFNFALDNPTLHQLMFDTENPQWQQLEMEKSMLGIKKLIDDLILEICKDKDRVSEYIFNLICLIKGYTFFANHLLTTATNMKKHFPADREILRRNFINALRRFILSIKKS